MAQMTTDLAPFVASATGAPVTAGVMPDSPDTAVLLSQYAGDSPLYPTKVERPGLQARIRGPAYAATEALAYSVYDALNSVVEQDIGGTHYLAIDARQAPMYLGRDTKDRHEFVVNFSVMRAR